MIGRALVNALVIVGVICVATFGLVMCYKYRCISCMIGYLMFAMTMLLTYSGGFVVYNAIVVSTAMQMIPVARPPRFDNARPDTRTHDQMAFAL